MATRDTVLATPLQHGVDRDELSILQDAHFVGELMHLDSPPACAVGHAVEIASDRYHAVAGDTAVQAQDGLVGPGGQRLEAEALLGKMLSHDAFGGGVHASIGDLIQPLLELPVEVIEVAEAAGQEEIFAHVAERPLDLTLGFGPVRAARLGQEAVMPGEVEQGAVEDDVARLAPAADHGAHAVIEDLARHTPERREGRGVAAQKRMQVLMQDEAAPEEAAVTEHQREEPHDALGAWCIGEADPKLCEVDLRLPARRCLEPTLETCRLPWADGAQEVFDHGIAPRIAEVADFTIKPAASQVRVGGHPLPQISLIRGNLGRPRWARRVDRRFQAALDVSMYGLAIEAGPSGNGGNGQALSVQVQDHDEFPKRNHPCSPSIDRGH